MTMGQSFSLSPTEFVALEENKRRPAMNSVLNEEEEYKADMPINKTPMSFLL